MRHLMHQKAGSSMKTSTFVRLAGTCIGATAAMFASAQPEITIVPGFNYQSWNAGSHGERENAWRPESFAINWAEGLRWVWSEQDGMGVPMSPARVPIFDPAVPGIEGAYQFPAARATGIGTNWENNAQPGESATFEFWFKPADLVGSHVLMEMGATNKGAAIALDGSDLVFSVRATDGAGGNVFDYVHRQALTGTDWAQAVLVINFADFTMSSYVNGVEVNQQSGTPSQTYRWTGGNPAGLGTLGTDPLFPAAGIAGDAIPAESLTDYDGMISIMRFYDVDLFPDEIQDNYNAITNASALQRRTDYNGDGITNETDKLDLIMDFSNSTTDPTDAQFPFPANPVGGLQTNDPALDETFAGDFYWHRDGGFNPSGQEPAFQFPAINALVPVDIRDPAVPSVRTAFVMNGLEGFRGPKFEQGDDNTSARVEFWMHFDDVTGNHCLFEAGGEAVGFSVVSRGDELGARVNTSADDGFDDVEITSGPGVLTPGWHKIEVIVRRFPGDIGQGFELYLDGQQVAAINDEPGPDGVFGTDDDINNFSPAGPGNTNFIGGNQSGLGQLQGTAPLPFGFTAGDLTPFNGLVGPFRLAPMAPTPAEVANEYAVELGQDVINARSDSNADGQADFFDVISDLSRIDAGL